MSIRDDASPDAFALDDDDLGLILGDDADDAAALEEDSAPAHADPALKAPEFPADAEPPAALTASTSGSPPGTPLVPASSAAETQPPITQGFTPPAGQPFGFTVDGRQVQVDGAVEAGDYIVIPKTAWDRQIRPNHLADRSVWREREQGYQREIAGRDASLNEEVATARAVMGRIAELNKGGPEAWAQWLDQFHVNAPLLEAQARTRVLEQQAQRYQQQEQERQQQVHAEQLVPRLKVHLDQVLDERLAQDGYKVLSPEAQLLKQSLWDDEAERLFFVADRDMPEAGLRAGEVGFRYDVLDHLLQRQAAVAQRFAAQAAKVTSAAKVNAAAVPPPKVKSKSVPPKDPATGQFVAKPAHWKDQLLDEDWSDIFEE